MPIYLFRQLKVPLHRKSEPLEFLADSLRLKRDSIHDFRIEKLALDARKKPYWSYTVKFRCDRRLKHPQLSSWEPEACEPFMEAETLDLSSRVDVIGAGPCGIFAALELARKGYKVHLHEQGKPVQERFRDLRRFLKQGILDPYSNILYGEGGAGAFSDGKLTCRTRNPWTRRVLEMLVEAGAPEETAYYAKAHIGTDQLQFVVTRLRQQFEKAGGVLHFGSRLTDIDIQDHCINRIRLGKDWQACDTLLLATGHSARDLYRLMAQRGVAMESKPFAVGFRVEHPQSMVNRCHLGEAVKHTGAAEYVLSAAPREGVPGAYSFCMCPGGVLIPCTSVADELCTNGMSYSRRSGRFANSGIVVPVTPSEDPLAGLEYQERLEREAFRIGGGGFRAPAQRLDSFLAGRIDEELPESSYPLGLVPHEHGSFFAPELVDALKNALLVFDRKMPGFIREGLLVSPETRTSSPIRVLRDPATLQSLNVEGLFPLGEGAGYAGGIVSSAADGLRLAHLAKAR